MNEEHTAKDQAVRMFHVGYRDAVHGKDFCERYTDTLDITAYKVGQFAFSIDFKRDGQ